MRQYATVPSSVAVAGSVSPAQFPQPPAAAAFPDETALRILPPGPPAALFVSPSPDRLPRAMPPNRRVAASPIAPAPSGMSPALPSATLPHNSPRMDTAPPAKVRQSTPAGATLAAPIPMR